MLRIIFFSMCFLFSSNLQVHCRVLGCFPRWQLWAEPAELWVLPSAPSAAEQELRGSSGSDAQPQVPVPTSLLNFHTSQAHLPLNCFIHTFPGFFFILCLFGAVLGTDYLDGLCKVGHGVCLASPTWSPPVTLFLSCSAMSILSSW